METTTHIKPTTTHNSNRRENKNISLMTKKKRKDMTRKLIFGLALLLMIGCQNDSLDWLDENRPNADGSVGFRLKTDDAETEETDELQTRGTPQNSLKQYEKVYVNVFSHTSAYADENNDVEFFRKVELEQGDPNWKYTPPMFWPIEKKLSFIAYASDIPFDKAGISFSPIAPDVPKSITYEVPTDVTQQPDLLVSTKFDQEQVNNVSLNMKHALACVSFCGIAPEGDKTYVRRITLRNVCGKGKLTLDASPINWDLDKAGDVTVFEAGVKQDQELGKDPLDDNNYLMTANGYLMMIPQPLKDAGAAIDVYYWDGENKDETKDEVITYILPVDDESYATWKPGQKYIYKFGKQSPEDITVVYYEKYSDQTYGLFYNKDNPKNSLIDTQEIIEAGYGVIAKDPADTPNVPIRLAAHDAVYSTGVELNGSVLYPVNQTGSTFKLSTSSTPVDVYFNNGDKSCGMIVPHFAKGVYTVKTSIESHAIRTPQQMRNITELGTSANNTYTQELNLDFSKPSIGGEPLKTSVVNCQFNGVYNGQKKRIKNVEIDAGNTNGALFDSNSGKINEVCLLNSSIKSSNKAGGITGMNSGVILHPQIIGNNIDKAFTIESTASHVGAIAGENNGTITGNDSIETATEIPIAEVSGWVSIKGVSAGTGGITGENNGTITTCLVNGVYVPEQGDVKIAKITIEGVDYVGGIVGINRNQITGNSSTENGPEPDVAGLVSITGTGNWVGGIAGANEGAKAILNQVNVRLGRGKIDSEATTITGKQSVGGIVGLNAGGTLRADGSLHSFISVRGNIRIKGTEYVGGIVGNNSSGTISNCFVYNFYSQSKTATLWHYAPKITGEKNVGGIVGYADAGRIEECALFSTVSAQNGSTDETKYAVAEVTSTDAKDGSAGGIIGLAFTGGVTITECNVLGNVKIDGKIFSGGIVGQNQPGTTVENVHVGNSGLEVKKICENFINVGLPIEDERMRIKDGIMIETSGTPTVEATQYVGGICGVNWGKVTGVSIMDNVKIGTSSSNFVGGIAGGNGVEGTISYCKTYNPKEGAASVEIIGGEQVGGIVGLNNGIVSECQLGLEKAGSSRLITIKGKDALGGIAGTSGGHNQHIFDDTIVPLPEKGTGNDNTRIEKCNVYGKVLIEATNERVGGIIGENGFTNRVIDCNVTGYTSSYTNATSYNYDITIKGNRFVGGIAGTNYGDIHGTSPSGCKVTHTAVVGEGISGGLVGTIKSRKANPDEYETKLYNCDVSYGVLILTYDAYTGAFAGQLGGVGASETNHTLFGTASGGPKNRVYTDIKISAHGSPVKPAPPIEELTFPAKPPTLTNLWADYQLWNYLYYTEYP